MGQPHGVAVDATHNIYVADAEQGLVVMFDHNGNFVRYIGNYRGEPEYAKPTGLAIDPEAGHIYLVDTPHNLVFILDLNGNVVKRVGRLRDGSGLATFDEPTDIALNHGHVFVLDGHGTSVQVFDRDGNPLGGFVLSYMPDPGMNRDNGLAADREGNIYVSSFHGSTIRVFSPDGRPLATVGQQGQTVGQFNCPAGLWIDSARRLYVADSGNGRVQIFQLKATD